jgi:hypothetical protein
MSPLLVVHASVNARLALAPQARTRHRAAREMFPSRATAGAHSGNVRLAAAHANTGAAREVAPLQGRTKSFRLKAKKGALDEASKVTAGSNRDRIKQ